METNTSNNNHSNIKKTFWKDKKNIAIIILSVLLKEKYLVHFYF